MYGFTAIKHQDGESILGVLSDYYNKQNLTLVEERIGDRSSKYANSKKWYKDLREYEADAFPQSRPGFTTNFDLLEDLDEVSHEWKLLYFYPEYPIRSADFCLAPYVNHELSLILSQVLNTEVIQYSDFDTVGYYKTRTFSNGNLVDFLDTSEGIIYEVKGYFENMTVREFIDSKAEEYLKQKGFEFIDAFDHLLNEIQRRPLYLKGSPEDILSFFKYQGKLE